MKIKLRFKYQSDILLKLKNINFKLTKINDGGLAKTFV